MGKLTKSLKLKILTNKFKPKVTVNLLQKEKRDREYWYSNPKLLSQSLTKLPYKTSLELLTRHKASTPEVWSSFLKILLDRKEFGNILETVKDYNFDLNQSGLTVLLTAIANLDVKENLEIAKKAFDSLAEKSLQNYGTMLLVYSKLESKSLESNLAVLELLDVLVKDENDTSSFDIQTCNNAILACKSFYSTKTLEIAKTLFSRIPEPDDQLISTYLSLLSMDALKNRTDFLSVVSSHYHLEPRHFKSNAFKTEIPLKTWTTLLHFCMKIDYPLLGLSWYNNRFKGTADDLLKNALGMLYKQTHDFQKALEVVSDPSLQIRICVDAQDKKVEGDYKHLVNVAKEIFEKMDEVKTRTCFDMISLLDHTGQEEDRLLILDILLKHKPDLIDRTRDMVEEGIVSSKSTKKISVNKELKLRLRLLKIGKAKLEELSELTVELDLLKRRINQVLDLSKN